MMASRRRINHATCLVLTVFVPLWLSGCASRAPKETETTLGSYEKRETKYVPQDMPRTKTVDARASYQEFARSTRNRELKARALERLADIELEAQLSEQMKSMDKAEQAELDKKPELAKQPELARQPELAKQQEQTDRQQEDAARQKEQAARAALPSREQVTRQHAPAVSSESPAQKQSENEITTYATVARQYEDLLKRFPDKKGNDRILYQLARAYDLSGEIEKNLVVLNTLVKKYPKNRNYEEAQFRRGEILFSMREYDQAAKAYAVIMVNRDSPYYERAIYKHGWAHFKLSKLDPALISFYRLLDIYFRSGKRNSGLSKSEQDVVQDTLRVVSLAFSFKDGAKSIKAFAEKNGSRSYEYQIYEKLSDLYMTQERFEDAATTFKTFVDEFPYSPHSPEFLVKVIDIYKQGGYPQALTAVKADFVTRFGTGKNYWTRQDHRLYAEIAPYLRANINDLARHYHALGQKTKNEAHYRTAISWYQEYVKSFPGELLTGKMNLLLAETLESVKEYDKAAEEYENTAYEYQRHSDSAEAGYAAILAHQKTIPSLSGKQKTEKTIVAVKSSLKFADTFPADSRVPTVLIRAAEELLAMKKYGDASMIAQRITIAKDKASMKLKPAAWAIIATAEFELGHHKLAEEATMQRLSKLPESDKNRDLYLDQLATAIYKQGEQARDKGNLLEASSHFLRISKVAPRSSIRATAAYDAAAVLSKMGNWTAVIPVLQAFVTNFPDHKLVPDAVINLADAYEKEGNWSKAAQAYEEIYKHEKVIKKKQALLWQTAELYQKAKRDDDTVRIYKLYIQTFPRPVDQSIEARQNIADIYKTQNKIESRNYWLSEIVKANEEKGSNDRTRFLAASASIELAEPKYSAYKKVKLVQPLKKNLKKKKGMLKEVIDAYTKAAGYGIEKITTASTYRIAEVYNEFSKGLFDSERPKGLSTAELEQYDLLLEEQAFPFEEKAIEIHETNTGRVSSGIYDEWVKKSFSALTKLRPIQYAKQEKSELVANTIN